MKYIGVQLAWTGKGWSVHLIRQDGALEHQVTVAFRDIAAQLCDDLSRLLRIPAPV